LTTIDIEDFKVLEGDTQGLSDNRQLRERAAASALFNWEEEMYVARAPVRLDVMGGIPDYSGSLVLQVISHLHGFEISKNYFLF
jgi:L-arabinokinase